nr:RNA-dependent RNA polymerase [Fusarium asiaticum mitovirus 7]
MKFNNLFKLYKTFIEILKINLECKTKNKIVLQRTINFTENLNKLSEYMLYSRFLPQQKKIKKNKSMSKDLKFVLDIKEEINDEVNPKMVLKFFKLLENFLLKRKFLDDINEINLGKFDNIRVLIINNLPKLLLDINSLDSEEKKLFLEYLFSSINIYRQFKIKADAKFDTISAPYSGKCLKSVIEEHFNSTVINNWFLKISYPYNDKEFGLVMYSGNASSPNSKSSSINLWSDVLAVSNDKKLLDNLITLSTQFSRAEQFSELLNHFLLRKEIDGQMAWHWKEKPLSMFEANKKGLKYKDFKNREPEIHSRLFNFTAPGGKFRVIANVDWLTQTVLSSIHYNLFDLLTYIPSDRTFNHKSGLDIYDKDADNYYSIDLSAATDRMPRIIQAELLKGYFNYAQKDGDLIARSWLNIVDREYSTKNSLINNEKPIRYSVGQGMGLFTSWPIMSLTHHFIVNEICGIDFKDYRIVGDDLIIKNNTVGYSKYIEFMNSIGMNVNIDKTIISNDKTNHNLEFARNYIISSTKINPVSWGVIFAWNSNKLSIGTLIYSLRYICNSIIVKKLFHELANNLKLKEFVILCYYLYKYNICEFKDLHQLSNKLYFPKFITEDIFKKIINIETENNSFSFIEKSSTIMSTLNSQCTVRTEEELEIVKKIQWTVSSMEKYLPSISYEANALSRRLVDAKLISIDYDIESVPTIKSKEKNILIELCNINSHNN